MNIHFGKVTFQHQKTVFIWLQEPHMIKYWDNSQEQKDDIINFIEGRKKESKYFSEMINH